MVSKLHRNNKLGNNIELDTSFGNDSSMSVEILDTRTGVAFADQTPSLNKLDYKLFNEFSLNPRQPRSTSEVIIDDWEVKQGIFKAANKANIEPERFFKPAPKSIPKQNNAEKTGLSPRQKARRKSFCARMSKSKGPLKKDGKLTRKALALRKWNCGSV